MINSAEEFVRLRLSESIDEYLKAAWEDALFEVWLEVIRKYPDMREWVAHNKTIPVGIMEILADDANERVRFNVATKNRLPEHLQLKLAKDLDCSVRKRIVYNKKATFQVLSLLLNDEDEDIRTLAKNRIDEGRYK
ncbi:hypothetical protein HZF08_15520 [Paenibacillus sp. CGMCC 1.16610]|uniref:HEAT repeat domain-containing protein n=1 Tax=Paenibacillus anseongense TaxID=2682845 RepID=A0ABW9ULK0_9BACL|nr:MULTISPECIES: hypothetical protein [Paenibacillus]MBA2939725.1 hypothetical protein [Paenibacillus sp. CGMCC 1.16610]MVQ39385.1 hypothetical protein [Paenibacillus anseongense]